MVNVCLWTGHCGANTHRSQLRRSCERCEDESISRSKLTADRSLAPASPGHNPEVESEASVGSRTSPNYRSRPPISTAGAQPDFLRCQGSPVDGDSAAYVNCDLLQEQPSRAEVYLGCTSHQSAVRLPSQRGRTRPIQRSYRGEQDQGGEHPHLTLVASCSWAGRRSSLRRACSAQFASMR
jgi:hypothetical protein